MILQHYLRNNKRTFLACNAKEDHASIMKSSKITIFSEPPNLLLSDPWNFPKFSGLHFWIRVDWIKTSKDVKHMLYTATSCKEILRNNTNKYIKLVTCGTTDFLLFWLHLHSQWQGYSTYSILPSCCWSCKKTLKFLFILHLALIYYLSIIIPEQNM